MKDKQAVSIKYNAPKAPEVIAKGFGERAEAIIKLAEESGILVHQDTELASYLTRLDVGDEIPKEVYVIIAELIAWSYILQGKKPEKWNNIHNKVDDRV
ncbi:EscU/YscU/HrcU family type III secretion system export apparatus switch protein [Algibacillus agarilyticus]|uniref:EscU/YscU/HrcU family type III secretion system export apparatus switch protein n=1 Tax=Algibacillus agarilyticus TaxID=2234133 RepID=UPI000DD0BE68|nr:EscU/YscU/HrcU family type III secretion system export apparatus switch protein [Algibacillus agarilyticus]